MDKRMQGGEGSGQADSCSAQGTRPQSTPTPWHTFTLYTDADRKRLLGIVNKCSRGQVVGPEL